MAMLHAEDPCRGRATAVPEPITDPDLLSPYLSDASGSSPGSAAGLLRAGTEAEISAWLRATCVQGVPVLPQAGRSSLTGGANPNGEVVVSVEKLRGVRVHDDGTATVGPGVRLVELQRELESCGRYYPPVPTYQEAMLGGTVSTNAGGAATFKYGVTRQWIRGIRVVLYNGDVLGLERGQVQAAPGETFQVALSDGSVLQVPAPTYRLPDLKKISAGYHASDPLDLLDLFIGSEGTLGLISEVTIATVPLPPAVLSGLAFTADDRLAVGLAGELRRAALSCRAGGSGEPDIRAIEWVDSRSLGLLKTHGDLRDLKLRLPPDAGSAVLFDMELPARPGEDDILDLLERFLSSDPGLPDRAEVRLFRILDRCNALESLLPAFPGDRTGGERLRRFRESVPVRVNELLAAGKAAGAGPRKVGGDLIVPFHRLPAFIQAIEDEFGSRGLPYAIWGHLSDGNLHPNVIPADIGQVRSGEEALLALGDAAAALGGCPLSEHGVGRSGLKQEMLRRFLGDDAILEMQRVKNGLDPTWRFAPGTLFQRKDIDFDISHPGPVHLE